MTTKEKMVTILRIAPVRITTMMDLLKDWNGSDFDAAGHIRASLDEGWLGLDSAMMLVLTDD